MQNQTIGHPGRPGRPIGSRPRPPRDMLDVQMLSEQIGYAPATIRRYAAKNPEKLPPRVNLPGRMLWHVRSVDGWLEQRIPELPQPPAAPEPDLLCVAFGIMPAVPAKTPGRGRPRGSKSSK